jgi:tellurium resistance protein TerD
VRTTTGTDFDLDASAIVVDAGGKVISDQHFVFFNNLKTPEGAVEHTGDNKTGAGEGDDEQIKVNFATIPPNADKVVFPVSIYDAVNRGQSFGQVRNAFIRVINQAGGTEIARYDLSEDASTETAMVFGELYRNGAEWKFRAVGQGLRLRPVGHRAGLRRKRLRRSSMGVSLSKGGNVSLSKAAPNLTAVSVGPSAGTCVPPPGADFDLDASALLVGDTGKVLSDAHFVFFNNLKSPDGSVEHTGDNLTGEGEGDDETINVDLSAVPPQVERVVFPVSIYDAVNRGQSFGQVRNAYIRVVNGRTARSWHGTTCPKTPPLRPRWSSASFTATTQSGSSARSDRGTPLACTGSPRTSAST